MAYVHWIITRRMAIANWTWVSWVAYAPGTIAVNVTWISRSDLPLLGRPLTPWGILWHFPSLPWLNKFNKISEMRYMSWNFIRDRVSQHCPNVLHHSQVYFSNPTSFPPHSLTNIEAPHHCPVSINSSHSLNLVVPTSKLEPHSNTSTLRSSPPKPASAYEATASYFSDDKEHINILCCTAPVQICNFISYRSVWICV